MSKVKGLTFAKYGKFALLLLVAYSFGFAMVLLMILSRQNAIRYIPTSVMVMMFSLLQKLKMELSSILLEVLEMIQVWDGTLPVLEMQQRIIP